MATYPSGVFSPTSKNSGDTIQAAHVNDVQAEVTAIEDALKNGIAHTVTISTGGLTVSTGSVNVGGPSSLATLQVNGTSTFVGAVTFSGGINVSTFPSAVTFSSGASVSTGVIRQDSLPMWNVFHSTFVAHGANSTQGAVFDSQSYVRGSVTHSTGANSSRINIGTTGVYAINARAPMHSNSNPLIAVRVVQDDTTPLMETTALPLQTNSSVATYVVSGDVRIASPGYLTFQIVSGNGAVSTSGSSAAALAVRFMGHFIG